MRINIKVIVGASRDEIETTSDGLKVHLKEKAIKGKANKALIELLAEHLKVKKNQVRIVKGMTSSKKIIEMSE